MAKPYVLIVEDDADDRAFIKLALEKSGVACAPLVFDSAEEAIAYIQQKGEYKGRLRRERPSLIILDLHLGTASGFEVLSTIRRDAALRVVPVIVQSGSDRDEDICRAYQLGANSYLQKPRNIEEMARQIGLAINYWLTCNRMACCEAPPKG